MQNLKYVYTYIDHLLINSKSSFSNRLGNVSEVLRHLVISIYRHCRKSQLIMFLTNIYAIMVRENPSNVNVGNSIMPSKIGKIKINIHRNTPMQKFASSGSSQQLSSQPSSSGSSNGLSNISTVTTTMMTDSEKDFGNNFTGTLSRNSFRSQESHHSSVMPRRIQITTEKSIYC